MNKDSKFLVTTNQKSRDELIKLGFQLVSDFNNVYTFVNCKKLTFSNIDDVVYTSKLCI